MDTNTNSEAEEDMKSADSTKATKNMEIDIILKHFNGDTNAIQDVVIHEYRLLSELYVNNR